MAVVVVADMLCNVSSSSPESEWYGSVVVFFSSISEWLSESEASSGCVLTLSLLAKSLSASSCARESVMMKEKKRRGRRGNAGG